MNVKITDKDKISVTNPDELYEIMRRILLRDNKIDREKEHFWMIGLNMANIILYIELVSMGSVKSTQVEPMNVFRVAVLKGATSVIALHNHPSGSLTPSEEDKDATDRLIQVGRILDIKLTDHLIITTEKYMSFLNTGLMAQLEKSLKYVPPYLIEQRIVEIRKKQEQELKKEKLKTDKFKETTIINLLKQKMTIEQIATVLNLSPKEVEKISKKTLK
ncbi:DNA repair protein [Flavobacterium sp. LC2016-23]|uniref:JAB domain-containing protein n=1 Tax=Flavobacterium sp. LC2016-23 TaxID=2666330 RepID=UPI0012B1487E|nr:JAB domain-containing protein [Flavobacterium sp. LC2016-23]MRX39830.1 DNA repair protein [Flavobacterium sp. LC2016-23]